MRPILAVFGASLPTTSYLMCWVLATAVAVVIIRSRWLSVRDALLVSFTEAIIVATVVVVLGLVSASRPEAVPGIVRWVPGTDLGVALNATPGSLWPWLQLLGNLLLLFPLGALLPVRLSWFCRFRHVTLFAFGATCAIEFTQWAVLTGRVVSTDDIILNTLGAVLGAMLTRPWWNALGGHGLPVVTWDATASPTALRPRLQPDGGRVSGSGW